MLAYWHWASRVQLRTQGIGVALTSACEPGSSLLADWVLVEQRARLATEEANCWVQVKFQPRSSPTSPPLRVLLIF
jgi:hypothetical protein